MSEYVLFIQFPHFILQKILQTHKNHHDKWTKMFGRLCRKTSLKRPKILYYKYISLFMSYICTHSQSKDPYILLPENNRDGYTFSCRCRIIDCRQTSRHIKVKHENQFSVSLIFWAVEIVESLQNI